MSPWQGVALGLCWSCPSASRARPALPAEPLPGTGGNTEMMLGTESTTRSPLQLLQ